MFHFDGIHSLQELEISRQRVLVRADLDCEQSTLADESPQYNKVTALAPTISYLLEREARVVIAAHRGSPQDQLSLQPCAAQLAGLLGVEVYMPDDVSGPMAKKLIGELREDRVVVYENLLLYPGEAEGDENLARQLSTGVEVYVGDCLDGSNNYASLTKLPRICHQRAVGMNLERELIAVNRLSRQHNAASVIYAAAPFSQHAELLRRVLRPKLTICAAGDLAATLLKAQNQSIGNTPFEGALLGEARTWLQHARDAGVELKLPVDARVNADGSSLPLGSLGAQRMIDIGPKTERLFRDALLNAQSAVVLEALRATNIPPSVAHRGTRAVLEAVATSTAFSVICAGPALPVSTLLSADELARVGFVSTAGQGFTDALCGRFLGAVEALRMR